MKRPKKPSRTTVAAPPDGELHEPSPFLEEDEGDVLGAILKRGAGAARTNSRGGVRRVGLPFDQPFRTKPKSLGIVRLVKVKEPPYGYLLLAPEVFALLERDVPRFRLFVGVTLDGSWFLYPVAVDGFLGHCDEVETLAAAQAVFDWRVVASPARGRRELVECKDFGAPVFPTAESTALVREAFRGRTVEDFDDPRINALAGRYEADT